MNATHSKNLPVNVHCPKCSRCIRLNAYSYLVSDHGLIVPPQLSLHCPSCHTPVATNTLLPYWRLERFLHRPLKQKEVIA